MGDMLLHICCGPCSVYSVDHFRAEGFDVHGFFYNPNIHPYKEYEKRRDTLRDYARQIELPLTIRDDYDLDAFLTRTVPNIAGRCPVCYEIRLRAAAEEAKARGLTAFSTTLLISPYQDQDAIRAVGQRLGEEYGLTFHGEDLRSGFRQGRQRAREMGLYLQPYCGCVFSERDRYCKQRKSQGGHME